MDEILQVVTASGRSTCGTEINYRIGVAKADMIGCASWTRRRSNMWSWQNFVPGRRRRPGGVGRHSIPARATRFRVTLAEGVTSWQVVEALKGAEFLTGEIAAIPAEGHLAPDSYETTRRW